MNTNRVRELVRQLGQAVNDDSPTATSTALADGVYLSFAKGKRRETREAVADGLRFVQEGRITHFRGNYAEAGVDDSGENVMFGSGPVDGRQTTKWVLYAPNVGAAIKRLASSNWFQSNPSR